MKTRHPLLLTLSLAILGASTFAVSQSAGTTPAKLPATPLTTLATDTNGHILRESGGPQTIQLSDTLMLRIEGRQGEKVLGTFVAKVNGKWVDVQLAPQNALARQ